MLGLEKHMTQETRGLGVGGWEERGEKDASAWGWGAVRRGCLGAGPLTLPVGVPTHTAPPITLEFQMNNG